MISFRHILRYNNTSIIIYPLLFMKKLYQSNTNAVKELTKNNPVF